jgi:hypothetical protein
MLVYESQPIGNSMAFVVKHKDSREFVASFSLQSDAEKYVDLRNAAETLEDARTLLAEANDIFDDAVSAFQYEAILDIADYEEGVQ